MENVVNKHECKQKYNKNQLELMTTYQLREICRREKIIHGVVNNLDKEELIWTIMRYLGKENDLLIKEAYSDGEKRLQDFIKGNKLIYENSEWLSCNAKIVAYRGLSIEYYDKYTIPYHKELVGTNALLVGNDNTICAILNIEERENDHNNLYITKSEEIPVRETERKDYYVICMNKRNSEFLYYLYYGEQNIVPEHMSVYRIPIVDFEVREPITLSLPMAIDFGSVNTTAGVYLDNVYFEKIGREAAVENCKQNEASYTIFLDGHEENILLPSIIGVYEVEENDYKLAFGYDALRLSMASYIDEGFCIFYDIKRWIGEYEKEEEIVDRKGHRRYVKRKELLRKFFLYVIHRTENRFKCHITQVHISSPVKQKYRFQKMFCEILPEYSINKDEMLDEGMAVIYNTISQMVSNNTLEERKSYEALVMDCGGGTTDLCSYRFRFYNRKAAYKIEMETTYENGDTDFGGNNLTYRIMQILKIALVQGEAGNKVSNVEDILKQMDIDVYRYIDSHGVKEFYKLLEQEYQKAEEVLPTHFAEFERYNRSDYYKVKNNFYTLFNAAEEIKKRFYGTVGTLKVYVSSEKSISDVSHVVIDKWKLSFKDDMGLTVRKNIPLVEFNFFEIELLLAGEIYGVTHKFMNELFNNGRIQDFSFIKLNGQSCKIDLFKDALKEFVPGKMIQFRKKEKTKLAKYDLKMTCVDGALKYMKDKRYGLADIHLNAGNAVLPYIVTAYTHTGKEVVLIDGFSDWKMSGTVLRNMEELTLQFYLKNQEGEERYCFSYQCSKENFSPKKYEEIQELYGNHILQKETDSIENGDVKFFVWANQEDWGCQVVPVYCENDELYLGMAEFYYFENDNWVNSFFDGMK